MVKLRIFGVLFLSLFGISSGQFTRDPRNCDNVVCPVGKVCHKGACYCPTCIPSTSTVSTTLLPSGSACSPNPCNRNCVCRESCHHEDGYYCESPDGFLGKNCDIVAPILICANNQITVRISERVLEDLFPWRSDSPACFFFAPTSEVTSFTQNVETCRFCVESGKFYTLTLPIPFQRCGTTTSTRDNGYLSYHNQVWANLQNGNVFDMPKHLLSFRCSYERQYNVLTSLRPIVESNRAAVNYTLKLRANIELCKTSRACPGSCPSLFAVQGGAAYTVAETVHAIMTVQSTNLGASDFVILHNMHISCTSVVDGERSLNLVTNGCETSSLNTRIISRGSGVVCVSFKVPRVTRCINQLFYIHAELRVVDEVPVCSKRGLYKRSAAFDDNSNVLKALMSMGPIYVLPAIDGVPDYTLYQDDEESKSINFISEPSTSDQTSFDGLTIASAVVGGFALVLVIASVFVCIKSDRK